MEFKKRKTKRIKVNQSSDVKQPKKDTRDTDKISMKRSATASEKRRKSTAEPVSERSVRRFRIIEGGIVKDAKRRRQSLIFVAAAIAVVISVLIINAILPTGLVEWSQNEFATFGSNGGLPQTISGDKIDDLRSRSGELFVMSDSYMYAYNNGGKCITAIQHGYNSPRLETSATRTLIYDRGSYGLRVDSLYTNFVETQLDNKIVTADICDKGYVAVATDSSEYSAEVIVFNGKFKSLFKWSAASGDISSVKLSPNGKYLAASVVTGKNGDYSSEICIFEIKSGSKVYSKVYDGSMFVKAACDRKFVTFTGIDDCLTIGWDGAGERINEFYRLDYFDAYISDSMVAVYHPDGDDRHCTICVMDNDGSVNASVTIQGEIDRICANNKHIFTYNDGIITKYDLSGNKLAQHECGYEYVYMIAHKKGVGFTNDMKLDYYS